MAELETEVKLLKKELQDQAKIHDRLDVAIEKLTDVSNSIHRMLAVHEEKISKQEEAIVATEDHIEKRRDDLEKKIDDLHSRITTNYKELTDIMSEHSKQDAINQQMLRDDLNNRVGILEKWRWIIIGGSIVLGFIIQKMPIWG